MKKLLIILLIISLTLTGCVSKQEYQQEGHESVFRYTDDDAGVVCWVIYAYAGNAISCLPISQTKLDGSGR